ncbi:UNVERIFIED_CONTAM: hypothetical protein Sradi_4727100 [Sesamum radiatum]|uniref:C3H1-type domain-containing protein n=1 Tax=Sesamum radiatum TaxID=300843 RepID=A0AAW2MUV8_SESRA
MENQRESKAPKLKVRRRRPLLLNLAGGHRYGPMFDPYPSESSSSSSPLVKYLQAADPSSTSNSPPVFMTRSGRSHSTSSPSSGGSGSGQSRYYKNRLCRFWENTGACQFGSGCQFAHGREELRPPRSSGKIKLETSKLNSNLEGSTPSSYGTKYPPISQVKTPSTSRTLLISITTNGNGPPHITRPSQTTFWKYQFQQRNRKYYSAPPTPTSRSDWTPEDDGIEVSLPLGSTEGKKPTKQDVDAQIEKMLYGTKSRKRLPVFVEICPDELVD